MDLGAGLLDLTTICVSYSLSDLGKMLNFMSFGVLNTIGTITELPSSRDYGNSSRIIHIKCLE